MTFAEEMAALEAGLSASRTQPGEASWMARRADDGKAAGRVAAKGRKDSAEGAQ